MVNRRHTTAEHLSEQWEAFVREYLSRGCDTISAYRAVYGKDHSEKAAISNGNRILRQPRVIERLNQVRARVEMETEITVAGIQEELAKLAFSDIRRVVSWGPAVQVVDQDGNQILTNGMKLIDSAEISSAAAASIAEVAQRADGSMRVKLHPKMSALDALAKIAGLYDGRGQPAPDQAAEDRRAEAREKFLQILQAMAVPEPLKIDRADLADG